MSESTSTQPAPDGGSEEPAGSRPGRFTTLGLLFFGTAGIASLVVGLMIGSKLPMAVGAALLLFSGTAWKHLAGNPEQARETEKIIRGVGPAGVLGVLWASLPGLAGLILLANIERVSNWFQSIESHAAALGIYCGAFIVLAGFGLLPTYAQAGLGGWAFGFAWGFPCALTGFVGASVLGYYIVRTVSHDRIEKVVDEHAKAKAVRDALIGGGFLKTLGIVTLIRVPPNSPFALTNLVLAGTHVGLVPYVLGTAAGMAPRTAVAVLAGAKAGSEFQKFGGGWRIVIIVVVMFIVLGVIGHIANKAIARVTATDDRNVEQTGSAQDNSPDS